MSPSRGKKMPLGQSGPSEEEGRRRRKMHEEYLRSLDRKLGFSEEDDRSDREQKVEDKRRESVQEEDKRREK